MSNDVLVPIERGGANAFGPDNEDQAQVVSPGIDGIEKIEAELGTVDQRQKEGYDDDKGRDKGTRQSLSKLGIGDQGGHGLDQGESRAETKDSKGQEEEHGPDIGAGHLRQSERVGQEADGKGAERDGLVIGRVAQEANDAEDGEASNDLVEGVAARNDETVLDGIGKAAVVRGIGRKVSETHTDGEEDLTARALPDLAASELAAVPLAEIVLDATAGIGERGSTADQDDEHDDWQTHGEVDDSASGADALDHAEPDAEPDEGAPADGLANETQLGVLDIAGEVVWDDGIRVGNDIFHVKLTATTRPGQGAVEGDTEVVHDPGQDRHVVGRDDVSGHDDGQAQTLGALVDAIVGDDDTAAVGLSDANLQNQDGDAETGEGDQVRDEPLKAVVGEDDGGIAEEVAQADSTALESPVSDRSVVRLALLVVSADESLVEADD